MVNDLGQRLVCYIIIPTYQNDRQSLHFSIVSSTGGNPFTYLSRLHQHFSKDGVFDLG